MHSYLVFWQNKGVRILVCLFHPIIILFYHVKFCIEHGGSSKLMPFCIFDCCAYAKVSDPCSFVGVRLEELQPSLLPLGHRLVDIGNDIPRDMSSHSFNCGHFCGP